ncbi:MAG TPA: hypothetical protein PLP01_12425, partial [Phycisphaerae bacterium]|nr:hypothetical protein [Phycisphaerae bacterium]
MADEQESVEQVVERLEKYGQAIAWKLLNSRDQGFDSHWKEEITQSLLLEGWKVWKDTGNEGLAKHRMRTRAANEFKKLLRTLKQPRPETGTRGPSQDGTWDWDGEDG